MPVNSFVFCLYGTVLIKRERARERKKGKGKKSFEYLLEFVHPQRMGLHLMASRTLVEILTENRAARARRSVV